MGINIKRGALIVVEGIDRTGKSTQCKALVESLKKKHFQAEYTNFPDRTTEVGQVINKYLTSQKDFSDQAIHLLFSADRWDKAPYLVKLLECGVSIIVDRYCYSGVAFSVAKGLDLNWCKNSDAGLPRPDKVFFLTMPMETVQQRSGFGEERYEKVEFQKKVSATYAQLKEENWQVVNANRPIQEIQEELLQQSLHVINSVGTKPIGKIWTDKK